MQMTKKILSIVLSVMMVASMVVVGTVVASAATTVTTYEQFKDAINTNPYGTITLGADISGAEQLTFTKTVDIDLNGHTITNNAPYNGSTGEYKGDFIIGDGSNYCNVKFKGTGTVNLNNGYYGFKLMSGALNIGSNVTFNCPDGSMVISGNLTVNGTINTTNWFAIGTNGSSSHDYGIIINDGAYVKTTKADAAGIYHCNDGELQINGGTIEGPTAVIVKSGKTTIEGGTLKGTGVKTAFSHNGNGANPTGDALLVESCDYPGGTPDIIVTGGTFESTNAAAVAAYSQTEANWPAATEFVKGGDFKGADPVDNACFADGTTVTNENGVTVVRSYICEDAATGTKYESIDEALDAAGENGTVKLITDIAVSGDGNVGISIKHNGTLDLNGHTITGTQCSAVTINSTSVSGKTLTFKDSSEDQTGGISTTCKYTGDACISDSSSGSVVIESGTYTSDKKVLYISSDDGWTINGGTFNGDVFVKSEVDITGGTVNGDVVQSSKTDYSSYPYTDVPADIEISGGNFSSDVSAFVVDGMTQNADGEVVDKEYVAQVGETKYETMQDAIDAAMGTDADNCGTVYLLKDFTSQITFTPASTGVFKVYGNDHYGLSKITYPASIVNNPGYTMSYTGSSTGKTATRTYTIIPATVSVTRADTGEVVYPNNLSVALSGLKSSGGAQAGDTVKLLGDLTWDSAKATIKVRDGVIFDLNEKTFTIEKENGLSVEGGKEFTVKNGTISNNGYPVVVGEGSTLNLDGATVTDITAGAGAAITFADGAVISRDVVVPEGYKVVTDSTGTKTVVAKDLQDLADIDQFETITGLTFVDGTATTDVEAYNANLLGVQVRQAAPQDKTYDEGDGTRALRYVAAVKKDFLTNSLTDYGFEVTVEDDATQQNQTVYKSCKGTYNNVIRSGEDDDYEYFTFAIYNITKTAKPINVKFLLKKGSTDTAYAMYDATKTDPYTLTASYDTIAAMP